MKYCRTCKKVLDDDAITCPSCRRAASSFGGSDPALAAPPQAGEAGVAELDSLQLTLRSVEGRVHSSRVRGRLFLLGSVVVISIGSVIGLVHHFVTVFQYAEVDVIRLDRNPHEPDRVHVSYTAISKGLVGFRREANDRQTELFDEVQARDNEAEHTLEWRWQGVQTGDKLQVTYRKGWSLVSKTITVPQTPPPPPLGNAVISGRVINAVNQNPLANAEVQLIGTQLKVKTEESGKFRIDNAPTGDVTLEVSSAGFVTSQKEMKLDTASAPLHIALSPGVASGQIRIVLTWKDEPRDLDAHLIGPLPQNKQFHIWWKQKGDISSKEFVNLDVDDTDGFGPETVTVLGVVPGKYRYGVHWWHGDFDAWSKGSYKKDRDLAFSGAAVEIYHGNQKYEFHIDPKSVGDYWEVCDIDVSDKDIKVRKVDRYTSSECSVAGSGIDIRYSTPDSTVHIESTSLFTQNFRRMLEEFNGEFVEIGDQRVSKVVISSTGNGELVYGQVPTEPQPEGGQDTRIFIPGSFWIVAKSGLNVGDKRLEPGRIAQIVDGRHLNVTDGDVSAWIAFTSDQTLYRDEDLSGSPIGTIAAGEFVELLVPADGIDGPHEIRKIHSDSRGWVKGAWNSINLLKRQ